MISNQEFAVHPIRHQVWVLGDKKRSGDYISPVSEPIPEIPGNLGFPRSEIARQQGDTTSNMELNGWFPETTQSRF